MSEYKGKLHETVEKFPMTDIWMDTCEEEALDYGVERGIVGATSNPVIIGAVIKNELSRWEARIREIIRENQTASEEDIAWQLIYEIAGERSRKLLPAYEKFQGKKGRLSLQTDIKQFRNAQKMLEQAVFINSLAPNMQVKMPANKAGLEAMEEATYQGVSINATVSFSVAQAVAVAEAVERGLARREKEGLDSSKMSPICTIMIGRVDDWIKAYMEKNNLIGDTSAYEWAGVAVMKKAYKIYNERGYKTRLLNAAYRNHYHWSEFIGGDIASTIPYLWQQRFENSDVEVVARMDNPVCQDYIDSLMKIPEFVKAYEEDGMKLEAFGDYQAFKDTASAFTAGTDQLYALIRGYLIG
ncbi:MAG: transaldolase family protein [Christensenellales bacterium]